MLGGKVIEIAEIPSAARPGDATHRIWVVGTGCEEASECAVLVQHDRSVRLPELGKSIWWQAGRVMFGGPDPAHGEVSLRKVGSSHDPP